MNRETLKRGGLVGNVRTATIDPDEGMLQFSEPKKPVALTQGLEHYLYLMSFLEHFVFWPAVGFSFGVVFASFFEWTLHRYVMHKPVGSFDYPFRAHAIIHHHTFKADHTYHLIDPQDKKTIPMAWWNGPAIIAVGMIPVFTLAGFFGRWDLGLGTLAAFTAYYSAYEYIHWCMHLPKARRVERSWVFYRLNGHHLLHHRYMHKNFNVVMPVADLCLGTLLLRSKIKFPQVRGTAVPDVQPRVK